MAGTAGIAGIGISAESLVRLVLESVIDVDDLREKVSHGESVDSGDESVWNKIDISIA